MCRFIIASLLVVSLATPAAGQVVDLSVLGLGQIWALRPVELDGRPGAEFLVRSGLDLISTRWTVVYPSSPSGLCFAGSISLNESAGDAITDVDGDGRQELLRFDAATQTVTVIPFPTCR